MRRASDLVREESGAMMLVSLFMALLLVGAIYFILGIGDAILYRRLMQDSADAGAYGAAVTAARGMNLHVLLNLIMMVTTGILLIIRTVETILELALAATLAANIGCFGCLSGQVSAIKTAEVTTSQLGDRVQSFVSEAHRALDSAHDTIQQGFPLLATLRGSGASTAAAYRPPVHSGFALPSMQAMGRGQMPVLPVEEGSLGTHCDRFAKELGNGIGAAVSSIGGAVAHFTGRAIGSVAAGGLKLGKRRTCKEGILRPPRRIPSQRADGSVLWLGQEEFQYRSFVEGESPSQGYWQRAERGVSIAQGGRKEGREPSYPMAALGQVSFAQSEYYFDGREKKAHWMWRMKWRGRLRRFRIPAKLSSGFARACPGSPSACSTLSELMREMELVR